MHKEDIRPAIPKSEAIDTWYQEYDRRYPSAGDIIVTSVTKLVPRSITGNLGTAMMNVAVRLQNGEQASSRSAMLMTQVIGSKTFSCFKTFSNLLISM